MLAKEREVRAREDASRVGIARLLLVEANQPSGLFVGQRREQHRLDDAEHGGRATDAQAERGHHHAGKAGAAAELPEPVANILKAVLDPSDAVHLVEVLTHEGGVAEPTPRGDVGVVGRHALAEIALGEQVQVRVDLQPGVLVERRRASTKKSRETLARSRVHMSGLLRVR